MTDNTDSGWGGPSPSMPSFVAPPPPPPMQQDKYWITPPPNHHTPPPKNNPGLWILVAILVVVVAVLAAFLWWRLANQAHPASTQQSSAQQSPQDTGNETTPPPTGFSTGARTYGGTGDDEFDAVALAGDGSIVAAGYASSMDGDFPIRHSFGDAVVAKISPQGDLVWATTVGGSDSDFFYGVAVNADGTIIAAGYTASTDGDFPIAPGHGDDALLAKFSADGDMIWAKTFGGNGHDQFHAVAIGPDGTIVAAGYTASTNGSFPATKGERSVLLATFSPDGALKWAKISGTNGRDEFDAVAVGSDGAIYAAGVTSSTDGDFPVKAASGDIGCSVIAKYSPAGKVMWSFTGSDGIWIAYWGLTITSDDAIVATGVASSGPIIAKYSLSGSTVWIEQPDSLSGDGLFGAALTVGNNIIAVGSQYQPNTGNTIGLVTQFDADGQLVWVKSMGGTGNSDFRAVRVDADGNIIIAGNTESTNGEFPATHGGMDALVVRLDGNGSLG